MQAISRQSELFWLTMEREGFSPEPYKCSQGLWTIGFGHRVMGEGPGPNWLWTHEDAELETHQRQYPPVLPRYLLLSLIHISEPTRPY